MTDISQQAPIASRIPDGLRDPLLAILAALVILATYAVGGFESLTDLEGDNDSLLRLVDVRDLIAGQGWFDLTQYRMGPEGGFTIHWSRLVDAPIAGITLLASALTGSTTIGETAAAVLWPFLLCVASMFFLLQATRRFGGELAVLPGLVIGAAALHFIGAFQPAVLDHHNVQILLALAMAACLLSFSNVARNAFAAGMAAALMLAVGMETAPLVAATGGLVALLLLTGDQTDRSRAAGFGLGFAGIAALAFLVTVPPSRWPSVECDAFSTPQVSVAGLGGLGLALIALWPAAHATRGRALLSLALLATAVAVLARIGFPECLADPYAGLDPRLKRYWLDKVEEAQPLWQLAKDSPGSVLARYATPAIGLALALKAALGKERRLADVIVAVLLATSLLVGVWQVRGTTLAIVLAVLPLSAWVGSVRANSARHPGAIGSLKLIGAWLVSLNLIWTLLAVAGAVVFEDDKEDDQVATDACTGGQDYSRLAAMPATTVLVISNLGAPILRYTPHRALAGPYHRNVAGNLLAMDAFMGPVDQAKTIAEANGITIVAFCRGNPETTTLSKWAPEGLISTLLRGDPPAWLELIPGSKGEALELYQIRG